MAPDIGWFTVSVSTRANTAAQAEELNNKAMSSVVTAFMNAGIAEKDIKTTDMSLSPIYQDSNEVGKMPVLVGF